MSTSIPQPRIYRLEGDTVHWPPTELLGPRQVRLLEDLNVEWEAEGYPRQLFTVPAGFICDGASVPKILHWYLGWSDILFAAFPHDFVYGYSGRVPSANHLYWHEGGNWREAGHEWTRDEADRFFARTLRFCGVAGHQRRNAYRAVKHFGGSAWRKGTHRPEPAGAVETALTSTENEG